MKKYYTSELSNWEKDNEKAEFKYNIRKNGILPILKNDKIFIYKISGNRSLFNISSYFQDNMSDTYNEIVLNDKKFQEEVFRQIYSPFYKNMVNYRPSTPEEILEKFYLNNDQNKNDFIEKNAQEIEMHIPINDTTYTKAYRKEEIQEIAERISSNYVTCTFKRDSKIADIINFILKQNYFDFDFVASQAVEFLSSKKVNFYTGTNIFDNEQLEISEEHFTEPEMSLSDEQKILLLKSIKDGFNIECIYCEEIAKISDFQLETMLGISSKEIVIDFAKHNSDFSTIYNKIISSDYKSLKKIQN